MAKNVIKGKKLMVFVKDETGDTYHSIALSTNHTLTLSASTSDLAIKTKDDASGMSWADSEIDTMSWSVSSESLVGYYTKDSSTVNRGNTWEDIMDFYLKGKKVSLVFDGVGTQDGVPDGGFTPVGDDKSAGTDNFQGYKGEALITSLTLNAPLEDNASYTVEFTGCGQLDEYNPSKTQSPSESTDKA